MATKKLFLLDAFALIYRAHFAFIKNPRISSTNLNTSAVFGFTNTLLEVIQKEKPTHIGVAFDTKAPTFRHIQYTEYKANRQEQPEDITIAIPYVKRMVEALNIPLLELDGFEADDIIGTIAKRAVQHDFDVYMYTPDKDYGQLVEDHIFLYKPAMMGNGVEIMGVANILERWGVQHIDQVVDMLGLMGDKVDNIPGIPGVGEKTAAKLLAEYGSIESILENADKIPGKLGEKVRDGRESALLSKSLARIDIHVPIPFSEEDLLMGPPKLDLLEPLLDELEFRTLRKKMLGSVSSSSPMAATPEKSPVVPKNSATQQMDLFNAAPAQAIAQNQGEEPAEETLSIEKKSIDQVIHRYDLIETAELRQSLISYLIHQEVISFDTETTDLESMEAELVGLSFSCKSGEAFYVPVPPDYAVAKAIVHEFAPVFAHPRLIKVAQNSKYDLSILQNYDMEVSAPLYDTMLAHYLVEPEQRHGMDYLAEQFLHYTPVSIETLIGKKGKNQGNMRDVPLDKITEYAAEDADITLQLYPILAQKLKDTHQEKLLSEVEVPLVYVLRDMERTGVCLDVPALKELSATLEVDITELERRIFETAGTSFNVNSPKQLGEVLFEVMKIDSKPKKTPTGQYATGEDILLNYEAEHPIVQFILDYRELQKLKSTYVDALPALISPKTGRIHTSYNQAVTATGRLSSTNPNLQNIPIRTARGREIRKAFIPSAPDRKILSADYSQIELRIMAAFSGDESMLEAFAAGQDIHATTAAKVFGVELEEVTGDMRRKAKMVNFGIIYGISAFGLAGRLGIARSEAKGIIDAYFDQFPKVKLYMDACIEKARTDEYVETILGRRRYLRDINSRNQTNRGFAERNAINAPIQGSAADLIKLAMIQIHDFMKKEKLDSRMILQVHDELIFDVPEHELALMQEKVNHFMTTALTLPVKLETGMGVGMNWLEAH